MDELEIIEHIKTAKFHHGSKELHLAWYANYNKLSAWIGQLEQHIRYFKPTGCNSQICDFAFPQLKSTQYVWIFYGGDVNSCELPYYKVEAINDFIVKQKNTKLPIDKME